MTAKAERLNRWIRTDFVELNTQLEELYLASEKREEVDGIGDDLKVQLVECGKVFIVDLLKEGNTDEGFEAQFDVLGNVGLYMAACRRHEITEPSRECASPLAEASALAMQLGASLGVAPRFTSAHLETHNHAINGNYKTFTSLEDEELFITCNTRAALAYIRASEALLRIVPLGVSHPVTADLLLAAKRDLEDVLESNKQLFSELNTDRFFYSVRPYYKPHRVGLREYRGANAGDFAGINVIDLLLGLCRADSSYYSQLLVDKFLFMRPEDQLILRDCMRQTSLMDQILDSLQHAQEHWFQKNVALFLDVCKAHGDTATQHHEGLVKKFIEQPAAKSGLTGQPGLTASGPPLPVLLKSLRKLADLRAAADRDDIPSRYQDVKKIRAALG